MSKFKFKGHDCNLDNYDLDDLRETSRAESKKNKQKKMKNSENEFFSNYRPKSKKSS